MTLSTQNRLLLWFSAFSALVALLFAISIMYYFSNEQSYIPSFQEYESLIALLFSSNSLYPMLTHLLFSFYVPAIGFTVYFTFEKTKSPEIVYFILMNVGIFAQSFALCIPVFSLHNGYTMFVRSISSLAFFGNVQVMLSILFQGVLISQEESRDSDRFLGIISVIALAFSVIIPLDTSNISMEIFPKYGFESIFDTIRIVFIFIAFGSMFLSPTAKKFFEYRKSSIGFLGMCVGYVMLVKSTFLITLLLGILLLIVATIYYLRNLHRYYMWK